MADNTQKEKSIKEKAEDFLKIASEFKLGDLPTEKPHPKTTKLSHLAKNDLSNGVAVLKEVDIDALSVIFDKEDEILRLKKDIEQTLKEKKKIFLVGCGATGRLSLALEVIWRKLNESTPLAESVVSFMAGGDTALIKAIENFEDYPDFAAKQLKDLGFSDGDLLIATTEGGETPFVIGATETANDISKRKPYFLYCNPDNILIKLAERSKKVIENCSIIKINLSTGPMGLSGSTRMQASTILMYAVGLALINANSDISIKDDCNHLINFIKKLDYSFLANFIEAESLCYKNSEYLLYSTHDDLGISILTDTTERAPTFSLHPFENFLDKNTTPALAYLCLEDEKDSKNAWNALLRRDPRPLHWDIYPITHTNYLFGFDFSSQVIKKRAERLSGAKLRTFEIKRDKGLLNFNFLNEKHSIEIKDLSLLHQHLVLKMLLNIHSTLIMGKLDRYENNIMTWVKPSNNKLIDRATRYIGHILEQKGHKASYDEIIFKLFEVMENFQADKSLVLDVADKILSKRS